MESNPDVRARNQEKWTLMDSGAESRVTHQLTQSKAPHVDRQGEERGNYFSPEMPNLAVN